MIKDIVFSLSLPVNEIRCIWVRTNFQCASEIYASDFRKFIEWSHQSRSKSEFLFRIRIPRCLWMSFTQMLCEYSCIIVVMLYDSPDIFRLTYSK